MCTIPTAQMGAYLGSFNRLNTGREAGPRSNASNILWSVRGRPTNPSTWTPLHARDKTPRIAFAMRVSTLAGDVVGDLKLGLEGGRLGLGNDIARLLDWLPRSRS